MVHLHRVHMFDLVYSPYHWWHGNKYLQEWNGGSEHTPAGGGSLYTAAVTWL